MSYLWNEFNIKTFAAQTVVYRDGVFCPELSTIAGTDFRENFDKPIHIIYVGEIAGNCRLERSKYKFRRSSQFYSPQERLQLAREYLQKNGFMTVADYCRLTGLLRDAAARELKRWHSMPEAGITFKGRGTHKVYILR